MKQIFFSIALLSLGAAMPASATAKAPFEGRWSNDKGSVVVDVAPCGDAYCGTVVSANAKAQANARKGGTANLIGTRLLTGLRPTGNGTYKGSAFVPKQNIRASATIRQAGPNVMLVKGCAIAGMICKEERWTRVR